MAESRYNIHRVRDRRHYHQGSHSVKKQYYIIIGGLLVYITLFRLILPLRFFTSQILLRVLYLIPIIYAGLSKGKKGGVLVSVIVSLLLLPHFFSDQVVHSLFHKENVAAIITFLIVGFLSGAYRDTLEEQYVKTTTQVHRHATFGKKFLIYLDQTPLSLQPSIGLSILSAFTMTCMSPFSASSRGKKPLISETVKRKSTQGSLMNKPRSG